MRSGRIAPRSQHRLRRDTVGRCCHMMAFALEKKFEELTDFWIVLDDQDLAVRAGLSTFDASSLAQVKV